MTMTAETYARPENNPNLYRFAPNNEATLLEAGTAYQINPNIPILQEDDYAITAIIDCGNDEVDSQRPGEDPRDEFLLIDLRDAPATSYGKVFQGGYFDANSEYLLIDKSFGNDPNSRKAGFIALRSNETITVGREYYMSKTRFALGDRTSRKHFSINLDAEGKLTITDHQSKNGTRVTTAGKLVQENQENAGHQQANGEANGNQGERQHNKENEQRAKNESGKKEKSPEKLAEEKWQIDRELALSPLDESARRMFARVEDGYKKAVPARVIAEIAQSIVVMRKAGMDSDKKIKFALLKKWHTDNAGEDPDVQKLHDNVSRMIGTLLG